MNLPKQQFCTQLTFHACKERKCRSTKCFYLLDCLCAGYLSYLFQMDSSYAWHCTVCLLHVHGPSLTKIAIQTNSFDNLITMPHNILHLWILIICLKLDIAYFVFYMSRGLSSLSPVLHYMARTPGFWFHIFQSQAMPSIRFIL